MVGNQDTDIFIFQFPYNLLDVFYSNRVDTGKWFVKHDEFRVNGKATCDFRTTAFATGQLVTLVLAHLLQTEFCYQTFGYSLGLLVISSTAAILSSTLIWRNTEASCARYPIPVCARL